jgi:Transposase
MHERCAGLDVHKATIVACVRTVTGGKVNRECRTFDTTTAGLLALLAWLTESGCTHVAMQATGVYWKPVWNILSDGDFELMLANAAHIKNVPGRKTDVNDAMWIADLTACGLIKARLRSGRGDLGAAFAAARPQAADPRADPRHPAHSEDAGGGQHQARLGHQRYSRPQRTADDKGDDRGGHRSVEAGRFG